MHERHRSYVATATLLASVLVVPCAAATQYRVIEGPALDAAFGMNNAAELAGVQVDSRRFVIPAIGKPSGIVPLPALMPGGEGRAVAINDGEQVAGFAMTPAPPQFGGLVAHAWYWSEATGPIDLTPNITGASFATAISNHGIVVGQRMEGETSGPFFWRVAADGSVEENRIGKPDITTNDATDVNENGLIAGTQFYHSWVYDTATRELVELPNSFRGAANGLNDRNEVVGYYRDEFFQRRTALWREVEGTWTLYDLGVLPDPHASCEAWEINNARTVIGECIGAVGVSDMPFVWQSGKIRRIDEVIVSADAEVWRIVALYDINESGKILAAGRKNGGPAQVVILDPVLRRRPARK